MVQRFLFRSDLNSFGINLKINFSKSGVLELK